MPTWLKILLPILVLVALLAAATTRVLMEEVPAHAQPAVLEERFAAQLAFLREMAESLPIDVCSDEPLAGIELDESAIRFGIAAGTRMMCLDMKIPDLFNTTIPEVVSWRIKETRLQLYNAGGKEVMQLKALD